jgi:hypothetical protein
MGRTAPASRNQVVFPLIVSSVNPFPSPSVLYFCSILSTLGVNVYAIPKLAHARIAARKDIPEVDYLSASTNA